jgi:hypothetical protein
MVSNTVREMRNANKILVVNPDGKIALDKLR